MESRSFFSGVSNWFYNSITGKPTLEQLIEWRDKNIEVKFKGKKFGPYCSQYQGWVDQILYDSSNEPWAIYIVKPHSSSNTKRISISSIASFEVIEPVFMQKNSDPHECICLMSQGDKYFVYKRILDERLNYFKNMEINAGDQIDLSDLLPSEELNILLKAIDCESPEHLTSIDMMYLLNAANRLGEEKLIIAAKKLIFEGATREDLESFKANAIDIHSAVQAFLDNIQNEMLAWCKQYDSVLITSLLTFDYEYIRESKSIYINYSRFQRAVETSENKKNICLSSSIPNVSDEVIRVLVLCEFNIEKWILAETFNLDNLFKYLAGNPHLKSIGIYPSFRRVDGPDAVFHGMKALVNLIENTPTLEDVKFTYIQLTEVDEKEINNLLKKNRMMKLYKNAGLFFFTSQNDAGSTLHGNELNQDCRSHILKMGMNLCEAE